MRNLPFVLWTVGYALIVSGDSRYLLYLEGNRHSSTAEEIAALIVLAIWVYIGNIIYNKRH